MVTISPDQSFSSRPLVLLADLGRSLTRLPVVIANNSKSDFETVTPIRSRETGAAVKQCNRTKNV